MTGVLHLIEDDWYVSFTDNNQLRTIRVRSADARSLREYQVNSEAYFTLIEASPDGLRPELARIEGYPPREVPRDKWPVHETHCCKTHGCKYGDENCPVELGLTNQRYECMDDNVNDPCFPKPKQTWEDIFDDYLVDVWDRVGEAATLQEWLIKYFEPPIKK